MKKWLLPVVMALMGVGTSLFAPAAHATANFVHHEQTNNFVATPICPDGSTDVTAGRYVDTVDRSNAAGFQVFSSETYSLRGKIEFQFYTDQVRVYYTTDGTTPAGALGVGSGTTQVLTANYAAIYSDQGQSCGLVDVIAAQIPAQPVGTTVKYIIGAWHSAGGSEIFANSGTCPTCTACTTSACATLFQYNVIAATLTVNSMADPGDGTCDPTGTGDGCTFREAVQAANNLNGATINFAAGLSGIITLGDVLPFTITDVTIQGPGAGTITVQRSAAGADFRIFTISNFTSPGPTVSISGLTIAGGKASGTAPDNWGGALYNEHGTVIVQSCVFSGNSADQGGAIANDGSNSTVGSVTLTNCAFNQNTATTLGGAVYNDAANSGSATVTVRGCTFNQNTATASGGLGGALFNDGFTSGNATMTLVNCTLSQNTAVSNGGGIYNSGTGGTATLNLTHCTFSQNSAAGGGALYSDGSSFGNGTVNFGNNIFKTGAGGGTLGSNFGTLTSNGYNLSNDAANGDATTAPGGFLNGTSDIRNTDPLLGSLASNGGTTQTIALLAGSPALDKGKSFGETTDQRGLTRPQDNGALPNAGGGDGSDIGAYELQLPRISINDVTLTEGNSGTSNATFTITMTPASTQTVTVDYATANGTTNPATAGSDYTAQPTTTLTFTPGQTSKTLVVPIIGDLLDENNETFFVNLSNATNAVITDNQGLGTINDNDALPALAISDVTVTEGNVGTTNATLNVTLSAVSGRTVTVQYATGAPGSNAATADVDYVAVPLTTLTFAPGETTKPLTILVNGDTLDEVDERFAVNLSAATNATIADNQGFGTIVDNDAAPSLSVNDVTVTEGNSGTVNANFVITLSAPSGKSVTVQYNTATPGSHPATAGVDYVAIPVTTLTFLPGETTKPLTVLVNGDTLDEDFERFTMNLKNAGNATISDKEGFCTINDDDAAPSLSINDVTLAEGNSGTTAFAFTVTLSAASGKTVKVNYQTTSPGSLIATPGTDYTALPLTTLTFTPGQTTKTVTVLVNGDTQVEGTERFIVKLSTSVNASISDSEGFGTITNDDVAGLRFEQSAPSDESEPSE